tara:strand:+ start:363 stop:731 length:369 start_codon:yes stop_codon:yes gene_type:complete
MNKLNILKERPGYIAAFFGSTAFIYQAYKIYQNGNIATSFHYTTIIFFIISQIAWIYNALKYKYYPSLFNSTLIAITYLYFLYVKIKYPSFMAVNEEVYSGSKNQLTLHDEKKNPLFLYKQL